MLKSGKSFAKIGSRLQMAFFFLFYRNFQTPLPPLPLICLVLPNVPTPPPPTQTLKCHLMVQFYIVCFETSRITKKIFYFQKITILRDVPGLDMEGV